MIQSKFLKTGTTMLIAGGVVLGVSQTSFAQVSEQQAGQIKQDIEQGITRLSNDIPTLQLDGDVMVEPLNGYYAVTMPEAAIKLANDYQLNLGILAFNTSPRTNGDWRISAALPEKIGYEGAGSLSGLLTMGKQAIIGVWSPSHNLLTSMEADIDNVDYAFADKATKGTVQKLEMEYAIDPAELNPALETQINMHDVMLNTKGWDKTANIEKISVTSNVEGVDIDGLKKTLASYLGALSGEAPAKVLPLYFKKASKNIVVSNVSSGTVGQDGLYIGQLRSENTFELNENQKANMGSVYTVDGFEIYKGGQTLKALPNYMKADLVFQDMPVDVWQKLGTNLVNPADVSATDSKEAIESALLNFWDSFMQSEASMKINELVIRSDDGFNTKLVGDLQVAPQSPLKVTGKLAMTLQGLSGITTSLAETATKIEDPEQKKAAMMMAQQASFGVMLLQSFGNVPADGQNAVSYEIELTPEGKILLNGQEISGMGNFSIIQQDDTVTDNPAPAQQGEVVEDDLPMPMPQ